ncbi:hypothetical protein CH256_16825 [Rhodococcus sp. 05-2254-6]|uniref:lipocalin-like domain-containing protein n=1 Tax=Nocardiaceae TaxID=85025 RepID=UPI000565F700|nr:MULTISPECIES: lipocalin-like domain-containing protein [Rhodococcus]OZE26846.1 hypothetical protein CH256_16825 [Rhodococcus sp. 05-2254-6]OZE89185.1 hypothetical protein CH302_29330 [Rhodococcus sp. 15-2388-1-1a]
MKKQILTGAVTLGLMGSVVACSQSSDGAGSDPLIGEWRMTSLEVGTEGDLQTVPYSGQITFTSDTVSVQAMNPDTEAPDTALTVQGYEAFYGDLTIDSDAGTFTITVESALARDLIGQSLDRNFEVDGDTLVLTPSDPADGFRVTYERHSSS